MLKRQLTAVFVVVFTLFGGLILFTGEFDALANEGDSCGTPTAGGSFMETADPNAPYDLRFIDEMIMHHRGAIMSSEMMIADSERPELRDLAQRIQEDQQRQIDQMLAWRAEWYPDTPTSGMDSSPMGGMMGGNGMMGGMMNGEMTDRMFLRMMIPHHQLAIEMAEDALVTAEHEELKTLAQEIIDGQSAEITEMEDYLSDWYDEESTIDAAAAMRAMMGGC